MSPPLTGKSLMMDVDGVGGTPSEGTDVASSSFASLKNQGLFEQVGLLNQQRGIRQQSPMLNYRRTWTCTYSNN